MTTSTRELVTVFTTPHRHQLHIVKALLAEKNIDSFIVDANIDSIIGTAIVEGYKLKVNTLHFLEATQIVQKFKNTEK